MPITLNQGVKLNVFMPKPEDEPHYDAICKCGQHDLYESNEVFSYPEPFIALTGTKNPKGLRCKNCDEKVLAWPRKWTECRACGSRGMINARTTGQRTMNCVSCQGKGWLEIVDFTSTGVSEDTPYL